jgi:hypothetical protein
MDDITLYDQLEIKPGEDINDGAALLFSNDGDTLLSAFVVPANRLRTFAEVFTVLADAYDTQEGENNE